MVKSLKYFNLDFFLLRLKSQQHYALRRLPLSALDLDHSLGLYTTYTHKVTRHERTSAHRGFQYRSRFVCLVQ